MNVLIILGLLILGVGAFQSPAFNGVDVIGWALLAAGLVVHARLQARRDRRASRAEAAR